MLQRLMENKIQKIRISLDLVILGTVQAHTYIIR